MPEKTLGIDWNIPFYMEGETPALTFGGESQEIEARLRAEAMVALDRLEAASRNYGTAWRREWKKLPAAIRVAVDDDSGLDALREVKASE